MKEFQMYLNPAHAVNSFKIRTGISNKLSNAFLLFSKRMYEEGYYFIADKYLNGENLLILNRSRGAESNFFVFIRTKKKDELEIFFSNPLFDPKVKKENLIVKRIIKENEDLENKFLFTILVIKEHSKIKPIDEYWGNLHSHIGTIH